MNAAIQSTTANILPFPRRKARPRSAPQDAFSNYIESLSIYLYQRLQNGEPTKAVLDMPPRLYAAILAHAATHQINFNKVACEMMVLGLNHFHLKEMFWDEDAPGNVIALQYYLDRVQDEYDDEPFFPIRPPSPANNSPIPPGPAGIHRRGFFVSRVPDTEPTAQPRE